MGEKKEKFVFISRRERQIVKTIKKPHTGNCISYGNKEKMRESVEEHVNALNGAELEKINGMAFQIKPDVRNLIKGHGKATRKQSMKSWTKPQNEKRHTQIKTY